MITNSAAPPSSYENDNLNFIDQKKGNLCGREVSISLIDEKISGIITPDFQSNSSKSEEPSHTAIEDILNHLNGEKKALYKGLPISVKLPEDAIKEISAYLDLSGIHFLESSKFLNNEQFYSKLIANIFQIKLTEIDLFYRDLENAENIGILQLNPKLNEKLIQQMKNKLSKFQKFLNTSNDLPPIEFYDECEIQFNEIKNNIGFLLKDHIHTNSNKIDSIILLRKKNSCISHARTTVDRILELAKWYRNSHHSLIFDPHAPILEQSQNCLFEASLFIAEGDAKTAIKFVKKALEQGGLFFIKEISELIEAIATSKSRLAMDHATSIFQDPNVNHKALKAYFDVSTSLNEALRKKISPQEAIKKILDIFEKERSNEHCTPIYELYSIIKAAVSLITLGAKEKAIELVNDMIRPDDCLLLNKIHIKIAKALANGGHIEDAQFFFEKSLQSFKIETWPSQDVLKDFNDVCLNSGLAIVIALIKKGEVKNAYAYFHNHILRECDQIEKELDSFVDQPVSQSFLYLIIDELEKEGYVDEALMFNDIICDIPSKLKTIEKITVKLIDDGHFEKACAIINERKEKITESKTVINSVLNALIKKKGRKYTKNFVDELMSRGAVGAAEVSKQLDPLERLQLLIAERPKPLEDILEWRVYQNFKYVDSLSRLSKEEFKEAIKFFPEIISALGDKNHFLISLINALANKRYFLTPEGIKNIITIVNQIDVNEDTLSLFNTIALALMNKHITKKKAEEIATTIKDLQGLRIVMDVLKLKEA